MHVQRFINVLHWTKLEAAGNPLDRDWDSRFKIQKVLKYEIDESSRETKWIWFDQVNQSFFIDWVCQLDRLICFKFWPKTILIENRSAATCQTFDWRNSTNFGLRSWDLAGSYNGTQEVRPRATKEDQPNVVLYNSGKKSWGISVWVWHATFISGSCLMYWCHQNNIRTQQIQNLPIFISIQEILCI